jgi:hypothetical protein
MCVCLCPSVRLCGTTWLPFSRIIMMFYTGCFLGAFARLRKVIVSVVVFSRMEHFGSHWMDFHETWYLIIFRKSVEKIKVSLTSDKNNGYCAWRPMYIYDNIALNSSLNQKYKKVIKKIKTHTFCVQYSFFGTSCRLWDNVEKYGTARQVWHANIVLHKRRCVLYAG